MKSRVSVYKTTFSECRLTYFFDNKNNVYDISFPRLLTGKGKALFSESKKRGRAIYISVYVRFISSDGSGKIYICGKYLGG